jgi:hypothetical protein
MWLQLKKLEQKGKRINPFMLLDLKFKIQILELMSKLLQYSKIGIISAVFILLVEFSQQVYFIF